MYVGRGLFLFLFEKFAITATERRLLHLDSTTAFLPYFLATFATQIFRDKKFLTIPLLMMGFAT
jgi:hypothetical protein